MKAFRPLVYLVGLLITACASQSAAPPPEAAIESAGQPAPATREIAPKPTAPATPADILPVDPLVTTGRLDTGLTYYIRRNDEPRNRAFLRLAVNAGSVLEDDDQLGLAHFIEHMAFNGTENFSGNEIISFLESLGVQFGPDVNAYTSFDETVYELTVPTDDNDTFAQGLEVLLEWAQRMTLSTEEIDKERGVVIEEWRYRRSAAQRIAEQQYPVLFAGSRYANRLPIGDVDLIASFPPDAARRFYRDWYRPELSTVVVVGDVDPGQVEQMIHDLFAGFTGSGIDRPREVFTVPEHPDTKVVVASDPETQYSDVSILTKRPADELSTVADYRVLIVNSLFTSMLNDRLDEITRRSDAPFIGASVSSGRLVRSTAAASLRAAVEGNDVGPALEALLVEARRVSDFGFTETEFDRAKRDRLRAMEQAYRERDNANSASLADEYVRAFLEGEAIPGIAYEWDLHQRLLPGISLEEVNEVAAAYLSEKNRVILVSAIDSPDLPAVTEATVKSAMEAAAAADILPYEDRTVSSDLLPVEPVPGRVLTEQTLDAENVTVWQLSNGARVVYKPTDYRADQVVFQAFSPGGSSVFPDDMYRSAQYASIFVENMGYGSFSPPDLERVLAGTAVSVSPYIDTVEEGLSGGASVDDLELLFQLIHLKMTSPRADGEAFAALKRQFNAVVANQQAQPQYQFSRLIAERFNLANVRAMPIDRAGVDSITLDGVMQAYSDRFGDASDFTFLFVGNIDPVSLRELSEKYLASLPASDRQDNWRDVGIDHPEGTVRDSVHAGIDPVSQVAVLLHGDYEFSQENNLTIRALQRALDIRMQEVIREDESGTYGVGVQVQFERVPRERYTIIVTFRADPDRVDELATSIFDVFDELRSGTLDESYLQRVRETLRSGFEEGMTSNQFWAGQIAFALKNDRPMSAIRHYLDLVDSIDANSMREAANRYLPDDYVQITLYPEENE